MDLFTTMHIGASALKANSIRMNVISSNMANVETTSTPEGGPYKRKSVYFETVPMSFQHQLDAHIKGVVQGVKVAEIVEDDTPSKKIYDPDHPDADEAGYVAMPNISTLKEMVDLMSATRSYEANATAIKSAKRMAMKALELGK